MNKIIGIDLGTTNSLVGIYQDDTAKLIPNVFGELKTPSVVSVLDSGEVVVGKPAHNRLLTHPEVSVAEFKRYMGTEKIFSLAAQRFTAEELSALVLMSLKNDAERYLQQPVSEAVISVPAYFNNEQRESTKRAAKIAGIHVERIINEPSAAALAYGLNTAKKNSTYVVVDMGGGTLDVSILEIFEGIFEIQATSGDNYLGGMDFTKAIVDHVKEKHFTDIQEFSLKEDARLYDFAEDIKLSLEEFDFIKKSLEFRGKVHDVYLTRGVFDGLCQELLRRIKSPIHNAVTDSNIDVDEIEGVILVGGATRMKVVTKYLSSIFTELPQCSYDPDLAIAKGATIQAALKSRNIEIHDLVMIDVCPHTLGVQCMDNDELIFSPIIERNTTVPASQTRRYYSSHPDQDRVVIKVFQGESINPHENILLGELALTLPKTGAIEEIQVTFTYDINGVVEVDAKTLSTGETVTQYIQKRDHNYSDEEIRKSFEKIKDLKILPTERAVNVAFLSKLENTYSRSLGEERDVVAQAVLEFKASLKTLNSLEIDRAREKISVYLKMRSEFFSQH